MTKPDENPTMTQPNENPPVTRQDGRVIAAECACWAAELAFTMAMAQLDVASKALGQAKTHLLAEQQKAANQA